MVLNQDIVRGIDCTNQPDSSAFNQVVDNATPSTSRGMVVTSTDTALDTPDVPNAVGTTKYKRYIWLRFPFSGGTTPKAYVWNEAAVADDTLSKWQLIPATALTATLGISQTRFTDTETPSHLAQQNRDNGALPVAALYSSVYPVINAKAYGAIGDRTSHKVREWINAGYYGTLSEVQADYPWVSDLDVDEIDWAAIQKACDVAWQLVKASYPAVMTSSALVDSMKCITPKVYVPAGYYIINKTVVIPPRCTFTGDGKSHTKFQYTAEGDSLWTNIYNTYIDPALTGVYAAFFVWDCALARYDAGTYTYAATMTGVHQHINGTPGSYNQPSHTLVPMSGPTSGGYGGYGRVEAYGGEISGIFIEGTMVGKTNDIDSALAMMLFVGGCADMFVIKDIHCNGFGATHNKYHYGLVSSATGTRLDGYTGTYSRAGFRDCYVTDCVFENLRYGVCTVYTAHAKITGNYFWNSGVFKGACAEGASIIGNTCIFAITPPRTVDMPSIDCVFIYSSIEGNLFTNAYRCIDAAGVGLIIANNSVWLKDTSLNGWFVSIKARTAKNVGANWPLGADVANGSPSVDNSGLGLMGNVFGITGAFSIGTYRPFLLDGTSSVLYGEANGNVWLGGNEDPGNLYSIVGDDFVRISTWETRQAGGYPNVQPNYMGQMWRNYNNETWFVGQGQKVSINAGGALTPGRTYTVEGAAITYNTVVYNVGNSFLCLAAPTVFTGAGTVYEDATSKWSPVTTRQQRTTTLPVAGSATTLTGLSTQADLEGLVIAGFDGSDTDKVVNLPSPALFTGRIFNLSVYKAATGTPRGVSIAASAIVDSTGVVGTSVVVIAASVAQLVRVLTVMSDGTQWHVK